MQQIVMENVKAELEIVVEKEAPQQTEAGARFSYQITALENTSNTELEEFTVTDRLPLQGRLLEINTGVFSDPVTYDIYYRTDASEEWLPLAEGLDGALNRHISLDRIGIPEGQRITELCWRFGTVPRGIFHRGGGAGILDGNRRGYRKRHAPCQPDPGGGPLEGRRTLG